MSRCFPYPPPGYSGIKASNDALIESIKLQRERAQAKAEGKKDRKREKKEKKDRKKEEKSKQSIGHNEKSNKKCLKDAYLKKKIENENDQLERSSLTEEHERPVGAQNPSSSSDSTQNSGKRKRHASSPAVVKQEENSILRHGNVIRIRLTAPKQKAVDVSVSRQDHCSSYGRTEFPIQGKRQHASLAVQENIISTSQETNNLSPVLPLKLDRGLVCSTSGRTEAVTEEDNRAALGSEFPLKKPLKVESQSRDLVENWIPPPLLTKLELDDKVELQYRDLVENWVLPPLQTELQLADEDWLFKKNSDKRSEKKQKTNHHVSCGSSSSVWPCAQFLPEADIYALPFTVPF